MDIKCKYCGSEMDLMDSDLESVSYACLNEDCNATVFISERYDEWEWEK